MIAGRWWREIGEHRKDSKDCDARLARIIEGIGPEVSVSGLTFDQVSAYVERRRRQPTRRRMLPAHATVNREVQLLRTIHRRAAQWGYPVKHIAWGDCLLPEPVELTNCLSEDHEQAIFAQLPDDWARFFSFLLTTGWRVTAACKLLWSEVGDTAIETRGKGDRRVRAVIDDHIQDILDNQRGAHETHVFAMVAWNTTQTTVKGQPRIITDRSARDELHRACRAAGVPLIRVHDLRHTAATRTLAATGNMKLAQKLLGHSRIETTAKYAHVLDDDEIRNAMEQTRKRTKERTGKKVLGIKPLKSRSK